MQQADRSGLSAVVAVDDARLAVAGEDGVKRITVTDTQRVAGSAVP
jgi:hypothetical protein